MEDGDEGKGRLSSGRPSPGGRPVRRSHEPPGPGTRRGGSSGPYRRENDGEETDKDLFHRSRGVCHDGKSHQDGEGVAESTDPRTVPDHPEEGDGKGVYREG